MLSRIPVPAIKRQKMPKTPKRRKIAKVSKVDIQIKDDDSVNCEQSSQITQSAQHEQTNKVTQSAQHVQIEIKKEKDDGDVASDSMYKPVSFERSNDFSKCHSLFEIMIVVDYCQKKIVDTINQQNVFLFFLETAVMKNFGIMCAKGKSIEPVYFPTEVENSGLILFNGSSDSVKLMISYPKVQMITIKPFEIFDIFKNNIYSFIFCFLFHSVL